MIMKEVGPDIKFVGYPSLLPDRIQNVRIQNLISLDIEFLIKYPAGDWIIKRSDLISNLSDIRP